VDDAERLPDVVGDDEPAASALGPGLDVGDADQLVE
jgi:hypothetical protein